MEVIYTGLHQSVDSIVSTAIQEDADVLGLSVMTGGHVHLSGKGGGNPPGRGRHRH